MSKTFLVAEDEARLAAARTAIESLSGRERDVLRGLADGQSHKMIGLALVISSRTVEIHKARMLHRLQTSHLAGAIRISVLAELGRRADAQLGDDQ